ncbi:MAG: GTPase HflX [Candidatus Schekmanbacteria bacterium]|nr:GTPase HflX [Candidatus Schekmanbacteria bacterium]
MKASPESTTAARERVVLVGVGLGGSPAEIDESLAELASLSDTAGAIVVGSFRQNLAHPHAATFIGPGKAQEIASFCAENEVDTVLFDDNLTAAQQKNLERAIERKVIDRRALILDIFAMRALTNEGKLQVELAQLEYMLPRLTRLWRHLSRQAGGIGTRGPGETQLETDRRRIDQRLQNLRERLEKFRHHRERQRERRRGIPVPTVSLVGYTNAGKSTMLNALTGAETYADDKLFATLDPLLRRAVLPGGMRVIFSDTVGFVRKLPHELVAAFRATLEEIREADLLLHCIDGADPAAEHKMRAVYTVLSEIDAGDKPVIEVYNKLDQVAGARFGRWPALAGEPVRCGASAITGAGLPDLLAAVEQELGRFVEEVVLSIPYGDQDAIRRIRSEATVLAEHHEQGRFVVRLRLARSRLGPLLQYRVRDDALVPVGD